MKKQTPPLRGFGMKYNFGVTSVPRYWYVGKDGIKRWFDTHEPCKEKHDKTNKRKR